MAALVDSLLCHPVVQENGDGGNALYLGHVDDDGFGTPMAAINDKSK